MTKAVIAEKVRQGLQGVEIAGITLSVADEDVYKVDEWWRVPVSPSQWPARMFDFYEALSIVEDDLQEAEHLNIILETGDPLSEEVVGGASVEAAKPEIRQRNGTHDGQREQDAHLFPQKPQVVVLSPDVAAIFPDSDSVNAALRTLVRAARESVPVPEEREAA